MASSMLCCFSSPFWELFLPRFLERDEALRRRPTEVHPWDGVGEVRPFREHEESIVEGVY